MPTPDTSSIHEPGQPSGTATDAGLTEATLREALAREQAKARRAAADARRAERETVEVRAALDRLTLQLKAEQLVRHGRARLAGTLPAGLSAVRGTIRRTTALQVGNGKRARRTRPARGFENGDPDPRTLPGRYRSAVLAALLGPVLPDDRLRVSVLAATADGAIERSATISAALAARDFDVQRTHDPASILGADVVVVVDPQVDPLLLATGPIRVGWSGEPSPECDLEIPADEADPGDAFVAAVERWLRARRIGLRLPTTSPRHANSWGDTFFARDFRRALRDAGWPTRIHFRSDWDDQAVGRDDVVVDLLGLHEAKTRYGACRVLWQISHPELATADLYRTYDLVFVASGPFARLMAEQVDDVPIRPLHQATDPGRFGAEPAGTAHDVLFVANWREGGRPILDDLLPTDLPLAVYGRGWTPERLDPAHFVGERISNDHLGGFYAAASIVLADHWAGMRREGFLSNRLYDAAATGTLVISDDVEGLEAEFDGGVLAYRDRDHLRSLIAGYLRDPEARRAAGERARRAVLERHTFAHRARELIEAVEPLLDGVRAAQPAS